MLCHRELTAAVPVISSLEIVMMKCLRCGSEILITGAVYSPIRTSFRPQSSKFLTLETGDIQTKAVMCKNCGHIEIIGDAMKLRRLTAETGGAGGDIS
jgi:DNA-directed RNA polymerase subunit RPC12/RpoP